MIDKRMRWLEGCYYPVVLSLVDAHSGATAITLPPVWTYSCSLYHGVQTPRRTPKSEEGADDVDSASHDYSHGQHNMTIDEFLIARALQEESVPSRLRVCSMRDGHWPDGHWPDGH